MVPVLFGYNVAVIAGLFLLATSARYGKFAGSALNPLNVFAALSVFFNIDFLIVWSKPEIDFFEFPVAFSDAELEESYWIYTMLFSAAVLGLLIAHVTVGRRGYKTTKVAPNPSALNEMRLGSALVLLIVSLCCVPAMIIVMRSMNELLSGEITHQVFSRENLFFAGTMFVVAPTLAVFLSVREPWLPQCIPVIVIILMIQFISGTRSNVILGLVIVGVALVARGIRISVLWYSVAVPVIA